MDATRMNAIRILLVIAASTPALAGELSVVKDGKSAAATFEGATCQRTNDGLTAEGMGRYLWAPKTVAKGDRVSMTLRASFDDCRTWPHSRVLHEGPSAYSDLAVLPDGRIACLDEAGRKYRYESIVFAAIEADSLEQQAGGDAESVQPIPFTVLEPTMPQRFTIPVIDISVESDRQVIVDKDPERYFGHPSTLLMPDGKTLYCAYSLNHRGPPLYFRVSRDGGLTWSDYLPRPAGSQRLGNCPFLHRLRDPDGVWRLFSFVGGDDNKGDATWQAYTVDGGETWTSMTDNGMESVVAPPTILEAEAGTRHLCWYHTYPPGSRHSGHFVAWVGTYEDILAGREGQYRVKLLHHYGRPGDCGYSGLELLPDETFVATTYVQHKPGEKNAIVSVRFELSEIDAYAARGDQRK